MEMGNSLFCYENIFLHFCDKNDACVEHNSGYKNEGNKNQKLDLNVIPLMN